jgi:hypothetical protein
LLGGAAPLDAAIDTACQNFQKKMVEYFCVVMKHPNVAITMQKFQRDPSFSARVSPCSDAWRTLINHFDLRVVGITIGLLAKLVDAQGETESIDAFL